MSAKKTTAKAVTDMAPAETIHTFKGFDQNLSCRGFQFEIGKTYTVSGKVEACANGFHACEHPLNCFDYYAPALSRFCEVTQSGVLDRRDGDTKVASATITIGVELSIGDMVACTIKWVMDWAIPEEGASATGDRGAASATGHRGAASATGIQGAASATGVNSCAAAFGYEGRAKASASGAIFLACRDVDGSIVAVRASKVGENGVRPNVWYQLSAEGNFIEVAS